jgi:hypothetical protein
METGADARPAPAPPKNWTARNIGRKSGYRPEARLATQTKLADQALVASTILRPQIVQKLSPLVYETKQSLTGVVVLLVAGKMIRQLCDASRQ